MAEPAMLDADSLRRGEDESRLSIVRFVIVLYFTIVPPYIVHAYFTPEYQHLALPYTVVSVMGVGALFIALRYNVYRLVGVFTATILLGSPLYNAIHGAGFQMFLQQNLPTSVFLVAMLGGSGIATVYTAAMFMSYGYINYLYHIGHQFPVVLQDSVLRPTHLASWVLSLLVYGYIVPFFDDTRNKPLRAVEATQKQREQAVAELALETRRLRNAVASYSHEVRTPLNVVIGMADSLSDLPADAEISREVKLLQAASKSLLALTNNVLDVSAIEANALRIESSDFHLMGLLSRVEGSARVAAAEKGLKFDTHFSAGLPTQVSGDGARLQQVIFNLLSNAIKYTRRGRVSLQAQLVPPKVCQQQYETISLL
eukprot:TRINITY_DN4876_c0_g1_i2.p1 TRINITY_DN4876_c0_g1~~TRINITY_DN4876_c0_g1_i2.p1  ORF type:complete len:386 (+),score=55.80 TRINITY_DN4876_c0_g1_i2:49-1158(+)